MHNLRSKHVGSLLTALVMVFTMLGTPPSSARADALTLANFTSLNSSKFMDGGEVASESIAGNLASRDAIGVADFFSQDTQAGTTFTNCASVTEIPQAECEALVTLYNSTNGASWTNHTNWLTTDTPCSWYGVYCTAGYITQLSLDSNKLTGGIPPELGALSHLN